MPEAKPEVKYRYMERLVWTGFIMASLVYLNLLLISFLVFFLIMKAYMPWLQKLPKMHSQHV